VITDLSGNAEVDLKPFGRRLVASAPSTTVGLVQTSVPLVTVAIPLVGVGRRCGQLPVLYVTGDHSERRTVVAVCRDNTALRLLTEHGRRNTRSRVSDCSTPGFGALEQCFFMLVQITQKT